ncbi:hypothetical protein Zmor_014901 [Zophobas morio]|uniref:Transposable element P transposase n=1 Tax=Zophobas morio TaxID=2755281 RepID=A0AA38IIC6_9CUCU|nr:hypothetical protein Zmor_014901 [Zophobas morio]
MIKGVTREWKQAIMYTFSNGPTKTIDIVRLLKKTIYKLHSVSLNVLATISDQGSNNQAAINYLMNTTVTSGDSTLNKNLKYFIVNGKQIIHIYDPPHLLKGIRNNLLKHDIIWQEDDETLRARWDDIHTAYKIDQCSVELRVLPKLTEAHVDPQHLKKMKVSCGSQVLSHSVASVISLMAKSGTTVNGMQLQPSAIGTASFKFF